MINASLFFQIAETANDVIIITGPDLDLPGPRIEYVNAAFIRLTGYSAAEAIGKTPRILQGPGTSRETLGLIRAALSRGEPVRGKLLNFAKNGAPYWLDMRVVPLRNEAGKITNYAAIERDVTLDKRRLDELEFLADRDTLTGIPNRRTLLRITQQEIDATSTQSNPMMANLGPCIAFIDVDRFKSFNDTLGHANGDAVLLGVADRLAENIRRSDMLGRIGGEEFAVCMPHVTLGEGRLLAERLRYSVASTPFETSAGPISATVSIGVAAYSAGDDLARLLERADIAMYAAKKEGRDRVVTEPFTLAPGGSVV